MTKSSNLKVLDGDRTHVIPAQAGIQSVSGNPYPLRYVGELEELLRPGDYDDKDCGRMVRLRIRRQPNGSVELLADSPDPHLLDHLLSQLASELGILEWEALLCG